MSAQQHKAVFQHLKERRKRRLCAICGAPMRLRVNGPAALEENKQKATYVCECRHEQVYVEYLKPELDFG